MEQPTTFSCLVCGQEFATTEQLELHRRERHPQTDVIRLELQLQQLDEADYGANGEVF